MANQQPQPIHVTVNCNSGDHGGGSEARQRRWTVAEVTSCTRLLVLDEEGSHGIRPRKTERLKLIMGNKYV